MKRVTSRSVPSEYLARTTTRWASCGRGENGPSGKDLDTDWRGGLGRIGGGPGLEPAEHDLVTFAAGFDPLTAGVGDLAGRLV